MYVQILNFSVFGKYFSPMCMKNFSIFVGIAETSMFYLPISGIIKYPSYPLRLQDTNIGIVPAVLQSRLHCLYEPFSMYLLNDNDLLKKHYQFHSICH